jgi:glutamine amidotransferase
MINMTESPVYIVDTGLANIGSVARMIQKVGGVSHICKNPDEINREGKVILPGVGHFDHGMEALHAHGFDHSFWNGLIQSNTPVMGICLGMQLLCRSSEEGTSTGLGLIPADVKKFRFDQDVNLKVPHMGWNIVEPGVENPLLPFREVEQRFYFVHTYKVVPDSDDIVIGRANYGGYFCAAFQSKNIYGVQFHPEKSHQYGMELFKRFLKL